MAKRLIILFFIFQLQHCFSQISDSVLLWSNNGRWLQRKIEIVLLENNKTIIEHYSHFKYHYIYYRTDTLSTETYNQLKQNKTQKVYASYHKCNSRGINFMRNEAYARRKMQKIWERTGHEIGFNYNYSGLNFSDSSIKFTCHEQFKIAGNILVKKAEQFIDSVYEYKQLRYKSIVKDSVKPTQELIDTLVRQFNCSEPDTRLMAFIITNYTNLFTNAVQQLINTSLTDSRFTNFWTQLNCFPSDIDISILKTKVRKSKLKWLDKRDVAKGIKYKNWIYKM